MQRHDWSTANPKEPTLHLSLSPCTGYQLQLASSSRHWCLHIEQPQGQHPPTSTHLWQSTSPQEAWDLRASVASWNQHREAQNPFPARFHSPFLAGGMKFPPLYGMLRPWQFSCDTRKLISSVITWLHKTKKNYLRSLSLTYPCLASICSEQCLERCMTSTSCVRLPFYNVSRIVFLNSKSLWIKASAKWTNVNVRLIIMHLQKKLNICWIQPLYCISNRQKIPVSIIKALCRDHDIILRSHELISRGHTKTKWTEDGHSWAQ